MEKQLEQAMDDLSLIKMVMTKTRKNFQSFSKVFIGWGIVWAFFTLLSVLQGINIEKTIAMYTQNSWLMYVVPIMLFGLCALILYSVTKKHPLVGLEKHLMIPWMMVLLIPLIRITVSVDIDTVNKMMITVNNSTIVVFALSILLVVTGILTELKVFNILGGIYLGVTLLGSLVPAIPIISFVDVIGVYIMPFTLLFVGVYLKVYHERSNNGTQFNS